MIHDVVVTLVLAMGESEDMNSFRAWVAATTLTLLNAGCFSTSRQGCVPDEVEMMRPRGQVFIIT